MLTNFYAFGQSLVNPNIITLQYFKELKRRLVKGYSTTPNNLFHGRHEIWESTGYSYVISSYLSFLIEAQTIKRILKINTTKSTYKTYLIPSKANFAYNMKKNLSALSKKASKTNLSLCWSSKINKSKLASSIRYIHRFFTHILVQWQTEIRQESAERWFNKMEI